MKSNYKRIGDCIRLVDERNVNLNVTTLLGLSITKEFIPSVANTIGTDFKNYKIIRKKQFACSTMQVRRDKKMPVALLQDYDEAIISAAYPVFEVVDTEMILPEYLMMWFSRSEFDREACFYAIGGVRGSIEWEDFCNMQLPVPSIDEQKEIINKHKILLDRIKVNNLFIQKLEETVQTIYKQWFIDFEFPNQLGNLYKSSGGKMKFNPILNTEIPKGWEVKSFTDVVKVGGGGTPDTTIDTYWNGGIPFFTPGDVSESYYCLETEKSVSKLGLRNSSTKLYPKNTVFVTARGTVGAIALAGTEMTMNQSCYALMGDNQYYIHQLTIATIRSLKKQASGAVFNALIVKDFAEQNVVHPPKDIENSFQDIVRGLYNAIYLKVELNKLLSSTVKLLLSKLATTRGKNIEIL
ncbi:restriction endonuclease subunit S [Bacillus sp. JNUCC-22]|uniref:restriction endonuclease subunit S n=1 Tax=Bacillus sp. JNUCC-22 TaxID=2842457 RepID=UPI001C07FD54|nr:restriction endonuclease subunit S [Bacillus sp. JNUCC-22]QWQ29084.1 restriction endonuclease subunit S [Bacillus sp. JNUCC-22]